MANQLFSGEAALVTGAGNGIGRAMALGLAREGARLLLAEVDPARGAAALAAVNAEGATAEFIQCDLSIRGEAETGGETIAEENNSRRLGCLGCLRCLRCLG